MQNHTEGNRHLAAMKAVWNSQVTYENEVREIEAITGLAVLPPPDRSLRKFMVTLASGVVGTLTVMIRARR